jgi:hypothetical protein
MVEEMGVASWGSELMRRKGKRRREAGFYR